MRAKLISAPDMSLNFDSGIRHTPLARATGTPRNSLAYSQFFLNQSFRSRSRRQPRRLCFSLWETYWWEPTPRRP